LIDEFDGMSVDNSNGKRKKVSAFCSMKGNMLDYQIVNLPFQVEQNFSHVFRNGWEMQLAKSKDPKIAVGMRKLAAQGPREAPRTVD
jgi:hypothetical protein